MELKHTPGPWHALESVAGAVKAWDSKEESTLYVVISSDESELMANARLIAAAPDLLASLQAMIGRMKFYADDLEDDDTYQRACQVFAKATGTAP